MMTRFGASKRADVPSETKAQVLAQFHGAEHFRPSVNSLAD
ncbi:hypothetical protein J2X53_004076 [Pseudorhodobacter sp. 4114]|nr:hypothetical protein [Pseudorhodobacter sp. 4114]